MMYLYYNHPAPPSSQPRLLPSHAFSPATPSVCFLYYSSFTPFSQLFIFFLEYNASSLIDQSVLILSLQRLTFFKVKMQFTSCSHIPLEYYLCLSPSIHTSPRFPLSFPLLPHLQGYYSSVRCKRTFYVSVLRHTVSCTSILAIIKHEVSGSPAGS